MNVCPVLVGRDAELARLRDAVDAGGGLVLVSGEAGIGKTRLLREFTILARRQKRPVVWARPEAVARSGPYALIADLLDEIATVLGRSGEEARTLAGALGASTTEPAARPIAARVRGLLGQLGMGLVLILEDLHLADELSQAVIAHLARSAQDDDVLIIATYRTEEENSESMARLLDLLTRDRMATHMRLEPLAREGMSEMVRAMWEAEPSTEELDAIARLGEGVPFFVEELAAVRASAGSSVPESIARAVQARMLQMSLPAREITRVASLTQGSIDPAVLALASGIEETTVPALLIEGVRAGLLNDQEGRLAFRHALIREAIARSIVSVERTDLHGKLAQAVEKLHGSGEDGPAEALALHWKEAGQKEKSASYYLEAGMRALHAGALEEARAFFAAAQDLAHGSKTAIDALLGEAHVLTGLRDHDGAVRLLREAARRYAQERDIEAAASALWRGAYIRLARQDEEVFSLLDEALALLSGQQESVLYARILIHKGFVLSHVFNEVEEGSQLLKVGLNRANALEDPFLLAEAHEGLAWLAETEGDTEAARLHGEQACELAANADDRELVQRVNSQHAVRLIVQGRATEAFAHFAVAKRWAAEGLGSFYRQTLENMTCWAFWRLGRPAEAERIASSLEATKWAREYAGIVRVWASIEVGDLERAQALLAAMWSEVGGARRRKEWLEKPEDVPSGYAEAFAVHAELVLRTIGPVEDVASTVKLAEAAAESTSGTTGDTRASDLVLLARALVRAHHVDRAISVLEQLDGILKGSRYPLHTAASLELRGMIAEFAGQSAAARARFDEAARLLEQSGNGSDRARCLRLAAEAALDHKDDDGEIITRLKLARQLAFEFGAQAEANRCESRLRQLGVRPRAGRPKGSKRSDDALSAREQEVVALVAAGATNGEIASRLFLSERTVQDHIGKAQRRLNVIGRAGLAAWAAKRGLV